MRGALVAVVVAALGCGRVGFDARPPGDGGPADSGMPMATCAPTTPTGTVIHVDAVTGNDMRDGTAANPVQTVTRGLALASPGTTVLVEPGDYAEPGNEIKFDSARDVRVIAAQRYRARIPRIECFDCDGLLVEGFEITGATGVCAQVSFGKNVTFRDNVIHDCGIAGVRIAGDVTGTSVVGNVIYDSPNSLVHLNDNAEVDVVDNVLFDTRDQGAFAMLWLEGTINTAIARNVIYRGRHDSIGYGTVSIGVAANLAIQNNVIGPIDNGAEGALGLDDASGSATISFNTFVGPFPGAVFAISRNTGVTVASSFVVTHDLWVSPSGTTQPFSAVSQTGTDGFMLNRNMYWNATGAFGEPGATLGPADDPSALALDPQLAIAGGGAPPVLPVFQPATVTFADGSRTTCEVRAKLIDGIARIPSTSPAVGQALIAPPPTDVRGKPRPMPAALGAYEP